MRERESHLEFLTSHTHTKVQRGGNEAEELLKVSLVVKVSSCCCLPCVKSKHFVAERCDPYFETDKDDNKVLLL